jgi:hypothetical protein
MISKRDRFGAVSLAPAGDNNIAALFRNWKLGLAVNSERMGLMEASDLERLVISGRVPITFHLSPFDAPKACSWQASHPSPSGNCRLSIRARFTQRMQLPT